MHRGQPWPLGASVTRRGVNFSVVAPLATRVEVLLFAHGEAREPQRVVELTGSASKIIHKPLPQDDPKVMVETDLRNASGALRRVGAFAALRDCCPAWRGRRP